MSAHFTMAASFATLLTLLCLVLFTFASEITVYQQNTPFIPTPLPPPSARSQASSILPLFANLGRTTTWTLVSQIPLSGDTGEPEGLVIIASPTNASLISRIIVSAGNWTAPTESFGNHTIVNGTDRSNGAGSAHLRVYDGDGATVADAKLTADGEQEYHIGGLDYDGTHVWATLAQYRPNTTATVISINPSTLEYSRVLRAGDHLGGIVHDLRSQSITCLNWGSRNATTYNLSDLTASIMESRAGEIGDFTPPQKVVRNPSFYVDYQDCKFLGHHPTAFSQHLRALMICSGVASLTLNVTIGGVAVVDVATMIPIMEAPLTITSDLGVPITQNPFDVGVVDGKLRMYFLPDLHNSTLYVYEAEVESLFQYGGDGGL